MTGALTRRGAVGCGRRRAGWGRAPWCRRLPASRCDCPGRRPAPAEAPRPPERAARGPRTPPCTTLLSHSMWGRSFMVGFGRNPPKRVHHAGASCPDPPKPCDEDEYMSGAPNPQVGPRQRWVLGCRVVLGCGGRPGRAGRWHARLAPLQMVRPCCPAPSSRHWAGAGGGAGGRPRRPRRVRGHALRLQAQVGACWLAAGWREDDRGGPDRQACRRHAPPCSCPAAPARRQAVLTAVVIPPPLLPPRLTPAARWPWTTMPG